MTEQQHVVLEVKNLPANAGDLVRSLGQKNPLEEAMATHSSILGWEIPWREEPDWRQSKMLQRKEKKKMLQRVRHDRATEQLQQHISQVNGTSYFFKVYLLKPQNFEVLSY